MKFQLLLEVVYVIAKRRWKKHYGLRTIGETTDKKLVVSGFDVFHFSVSYGLPLDIIIDYLHNINKIIAWSEFIETALQNNWSITNTLIKIETANMDIHGKEYTENLIEHCKYFIGEYYKR